MKVTRTGRGRTVQVPDDVMQALSLRDGDEVRVGREKASAEQAAAILATRTEADWKATLAVMERTDALAQPLPPGHRFDREEADARR